MLWIRRKVAGNFVKLTFLWPVLVIVICAQSETIRSQPIRSEKDIREAARGNGFEYGAPVDRYFQPRPGNRFNPRRSYVIYDDSFGERWTPYRMEYYPTGNGYLRQAPNRYFAPDDYPRIKPSMSYQTVFSNIIRVYDRGDGDKNRGSRPSYGYEKTYPPMFVPNEGYSVDGEKDYKGGRPNTGFYETHTVNYDPSAESSSRFVQIPQEYNKRLKKMYLCNYIRLNNQEFPEKNGPCARSEDIPLTVSNYPDYSSYPSEAAPIEHRHRIRTKRSEPKTKRWTNIAYGYDSYRGLYSPYEYDGYLTRYYPSYGGYNDFYRNGHRNNRYGNENQKSQESNFRGLTSYLTNGGRREQSRHRNGDNNDGDKNEDSNEDDSDEEMENQEDRHNNNNNSYDNSRRRNNRNNNSNNRHNNNDDNDNHNNRNNNNNRNNRNNNNRNNRNNNNSRNQRRNNNRGNNNNSNRNRNGGRYGDYGGSSSGSGYGGGSGYGSSSGSGSGSGYSSSGSGYGNSGYGSNGGYGSSGYGNNGRYGGGGGYGNNGGGSYWSW